MKYIRPEMNISVFDRENIVTLSNGFSNITDRTAYTESVSYSELQDDIADTLAIK